MNTKIQLQHPAGKKAVHMNKDKYDMLQSAILDHLQACSESSHTELVYEVVQRIN